MSYRYTANNDFIDGFFETKIGFPLTYAFCTYHATGWTASNCMVFTIGTQGAANAFDAVALMETSTGLVGRIYDTNDTDISDTPAVARTEVNQWHRVVMTVTAASSTQSDQHDLYVDGALMTQTQTANRNITLFNSWKFGGDFPGAQDWASIAGNARYTAEIGIWNEVLSSEEIDAFMRGRTPAMVRPQNLVCYYPLKTHLKQVAGNQYCGDLVPNNTVSQNSLHPTMYDQISPAGINPLQGRAAVKRFKPASAGRIRSIWLGGG